MVTTLISTSNARRITCIMPVSRKAAIDRSAGYKSKQTCLAFVRSYINADEKCLRMTHQ